MAKLRIYFPHIGDTRRWINGWDLLAFFIVFSIFVLFAWGARQMTAPYHVGEALSISLSVYDLPGYAVRSVLRIVIALFFSLLFTFIFGTWAAKSARAERFILPFIDVLQSVPVLSFLSIFFVFFVALFPNSLFGPECASVFVIFTSQAWNITLGFYQSLRQVPEELKEAARLFHLNKWQQFWRVEVPFCLPSLLWNTMMSLSASWFFVVASEAIFISNQEVRLPGIGSYLAQAIDQSNLHAVGYAIVMMLIVILCYDQIIFRPLIAWSERFYCEGSEDAANASSSWVLTVLHRTRLMQYFSNYLSIWVERFVNFKWFKHSGHHHFTIGRRYRYYSRIWQLVAWGISILCLATLLRFITVSVSINEIAQVFLFGLATASRVFILIIIASLIWIPIGVWIGMQPRVSQIVQPIAQFLAAFPANALFPIVVLLIIRYHLNVEIWLTPLMILGSQWYILFNVIAAASNMPKELRQVAQNFGVKGWLWWKRLILPWIFPYYITGAITAAGGAWNASIVAEIVNWGNTTLQATGLGAYIAKCTGAGDFPRIALGTAVMCILVLIFNRLVWRPLYQFAQERFQTN